MKLLANNESNSLVDSANLLRKVDFPRLAIPLATMLSRVIDYAFIAPPASSAFCRTPSLVMKIYWAN